jgi:hypothetical protein
MLRITLALSCLLATTAACDTLPVGTPDDLAAAPVLPPPPPVPPKCEPGCESSLCIPCPEEK